MISQRIRRQVFANAVDRLREESRTEAPLLRDDLPRIADFHRQTQQTYVRYPQMPRLLESPQFGDNRLVRRLNLNVEEQPTLENYLANIRSNDYQIGGDPDQALLSSYIRTNFNDDYETIRTVGEVIQHPQAVTTADLDSIGNSLVQVYGALGNLDRQQAFNWFYQQLPFPPRNILPELVESQQNMLQINDLTRTMVANASAEHEQRIREIAEQAHDNASQSFLSSFQDLIDLTPVLDIIINNKMAVGGGALLTLSSVSYYAYHNPDSLKWVFTNFLEKPFHNLISQKPIQQNLEVYQTVAKIQKEMISNERESTKVLLGKILDNVYEGIKNFFFK